jgi:single-strand DNA-binding protein
MPLPSITLIGNLTADPELRFTNAGKPWVTFTIAANERRKTETGEWVDGDTCFMDVTSWRSAEQQAVRQSQNPGNNRISRRRLP